MTDILEGFISVDEETDTIAPVQLSNTFWYDQWKLSKIPLSRMELDLRVAKKELRKILSGQTLPPTALSVKLCDYFGVDYIKGAEEFNKSHEEWLIKNPGKFKKRSYIRKRKFDLSRVSPESVEVPNVPDPDSIKAEVVTSEISKDKIDAVLRCVYGKVDFDTYKQVRHILNS